MSESVVIRRMVGLSKSTIGLKVLVAVTGIGLFGFVIGHLLGNLQLFLGPAKLNAYAHLLKSNPELLWTARLSLLPIVIIHVVGTIKLKLRSQSARPTAYQYNDTVVASRAARSMMYTGLVLLSFIIFHLAHYTLFLVHPEFANLRDSLGHHDVYSMVVLGFSNPIISGVYIFSILLLGLHLSHGIQSLFQTLGLNNSQWRPLWQNLGRGLALLLTLGNISMPAAVLLELVKLPPGVVSP